MTTWCKNDFATVTLSLSDAPEPAGMLPQNFDICPAPPRLKVTGPGYFDMPVGTVFRAAISSCGSHGVGGVGAGHTVTDSWGSSATRAHSDFSDSTQDRAPSDDSSDVSSSSGTEDSEESANLQMLEGQASPKTTVMMRNVPKSYTRATLLELLNMEGFFGSYDFIYFPVHFNSMKSFGYVFINLVSRCEAERFMEYFQNFTKWTVPSPKVCQMTWGDCHQGLAAHVHRYRSSPVMHEELPDEGKPAVFSDGVRAPFPPPLFQIRRPRIRNR